MLAAAVFWSAVLVAGSSAYVPLDVLVPSASTMSQHAHDKQISCRPASHALDYDGAMRKHEVERSSYELLSKPGGPGQM